MSIFRVTSGISKEEREQRLKQKAKVIWMTGLSGSGKTTLAYLLERELLNQGKICFVLDGDNLRSGLNADLGFTESDRRENIRRAGEISKLFVDAGIILITSFISPFRADRNKIRSLFQAGEFFEVYINSPLEICEQRDPKGLYKKARAGEISAFTGIDSPYESPDSPELELKTNLLSEEECILELLKVVS